MDRCISAVDRGLRAVFATPSANRSSPARSLPAETQAGPLSPEQARLSAALMRVNHVGEVCAQALYQSQGLFTRSPELRQHFSIAAQEEVDHLAWTRQRLDELGGRPSYLNPLWFGGAFAMGSLAGLLGDRVSLGFVVATERQVEQHLASHLDRLPEADLASRAVVAQMREDEARHADEAEAAGARALPAPVQGLMRLAAKVMTGTAHHL